MKQQVIVPNNYTLCIKGDCPIGFTEYGKEG